MIEDLDIVGLGIKVNDRLNNALPGLETQPGGLGFLQIDLALGLDIGRWENKVNRRVEG